MRNLLWVLASLECLAAMSCRARRQAESAERHIARAVRFLECRSLSRDPSEPWQRVLGALEAEQE